MEETKKAVFTFVDYKIVQINYDLTKIENHEGIRIKFNPSGVFDETGKLFVLTFDFSVFEKNKTTADSFISGKMAVEYLFENIETLEEIPPYFYKNSIAICFPYLRAFLSNLTLQANGKLLILPTMNLSGLEMPLKENTRLK